jgi:hypothetical protein
MSRALKVTLAAAVLTWLAAAAVVVWFVFQVVPRGGC